VTPFGQDILLMPTRNFNLNNEKTRKKILQHEHFILLIKAVLIIVCYLKKYKNYERLQKLRKY